MSSVTQRSNTAKLINVAPAPLSKASNKELTKPVETLTTKESSLARLLASCCDCV